jgi:hypothetical protein
MMVRRIGKGRHGLTVVAVIVCFIVMTTVGLAILKLGILQHHQINAQERRLQAEWLAVSGMQRALARLQCDRAYTGEVWLVEPSDLLLKEPASPSRSDAKTGAPAARITIHVEQVPGAALRRMVRVQADCPTDPPRRARHSQHKLIDLELVKPGAAS